MLTQAENPLRKNYGKIPFVSAAHNNDERDGRGRCDVVMCVVVV